MRVQLSFDPRRWVGPHRSRDAMFSDGQNPLEKTVFKIFCAAIVLGGTVWGSNSQGGEPKRSSTDKPNLIVILADDLGYSDVGFQRERLMDEVDSKLTHEPIPTPHLDRLAKAGTQFSCGYVSGPYCSPSRAGLLTGRYQQRFGHEFNPSGGGKGLALSESTLADRLTERGYRTALIGKWHLGNTEELHPLNRGFHEFYGFLGGANSFLPDESGAVPNILRGREPLNETRYLTDAIGDEAANFVARNADSPFFLFLSFNAVHTPMHADRERLEKFAYIQDEQRRKYAAMLSALDDAVGSVVGVLKEKGLEENTLIAFLSDNGGPTMPTTTINGAVNAPLRGSKRQTLEGGVRVPFVITWKSVLPEGVVKADPVIQLDLQPTFLAAAGVEPGENDRFDGVNLLPYLQGTSTAEPHKALFWRFGEQTAVRSGDWKLVRYGRTDKVDPEETWPKLYNLKEDIGESRDLAAENPDKVIELERLWKEWDESNVPPSWPSNIGRR